MPTIRVPWDPATVSPCHAAAFRRRSRNYMASMEYFQFLFLACLASSVYAFCPVVPFHSSLRLNSPLRQRSSSIAALTALKMRLDRVDGDSETIIIARANAISVGPNSRDHEEERHYYEEQPAPSSMLAMEKSGVNKMLVFSFAAALIAGGYFGLKHYKARQEKLVQDFAVTKIASWGNIKSSGFIFRRFKRQFGPVFNWWFHRGDMFQAYLKRLVMEKPLCIKTLQDLNETARALRISKDGAAKTIVKVAAELMPYPSTAPRIQRDKNRPEDLSKLLWLTTRILPSPAAIAGIRALFPFDYGPEVVDDLQIAHTRQAYRDIVIAAGGPEKVYRDITNATAIDGPEKGCPPGYEELGMTQAEAASLVAKMVMRKRKIAQAQAKADAKKAEDDRAYRALRQTVALEARDWDGEAKARAAGGAGGASKGVGESDGDVQRAPGANEYECTKCGYTLFVAAGRDFKFYGDDFKCSQCGAGKEFFRNNAA